MSPVIDGCSTGRPRFPRVSGDEPILRVLEGKAEMFSPRERG